MTKPIYHWTKEQDKILIKDYPGGDVKSLAKKLNRSHQAINHRARKLGIRYTVVPKAKRAYKLKHKHKLTIEQYDTMFESQGGVCAICGKPEVHKHQSGATLRLAVDHNHFTNKIRGLLCRKCNLGIGNLLVDENGIMLLLKAIEYLENTDGK